MLWLSFVKPLVVVPVLGRNRSVRLYCSALIGQNKGTLRPPTDLSRVSHLYVYKCMEAGLNSCITVPSKVCAPKVLTPGQANVRTISYRKAIATTDPAILEPLLRQFR